MTQIFKNRLDFIKRKDKKINGVSENFVEKNPNWEEMNEPNEAAMADIKLCAEKELTTIKN